MTRMSTMQARDKFAEVVNQVAYGKERVVITRRGKPLAVIVPLEDVETLEAMEDRMDLEDARRVLREWERGGRQSVPLDQVLERLGLERRDLA